MPELMEIMGDIPPELLTDEPAGEGTRASAAEDTGDDTEEEDDATGDDTTEDTDDTTEDDAATGDDTEEEDDAEDDYVAKVDDDKPTVTTTADQPDERTFILNGLTKFQTQVVVPGADGKDEIKTVEAYGWGDLPRDMKGFVSAYEQGIFTSNVQNQELKARELQQQYRQNQQQAQTDLHIQRENRMIADDLTELRQEGTFPKFKGVPGSKEFNESPGAKEFDRVTAYMNEQNDKYLKANLNNGKAYRHIGFREAFIMLNGPNVKAADKKDMQGRRAVAARLKTTTGAKKGTRNVRPTRVTNLTDLADEFQDFIGGSA